MECQIFLRNMYLIFRQYDYYNIEQFSSLCLFTGVPQNEIFDLLPKKLSNHTSLLMSVITDYHMILGLTEIKN